MSISSIRDVAARANVSVGTVSNVLNRPAKVSQKTIDRVLAAIEELQFVRNDAARQLRAGQSRSIGLVVLDVGNPFFTDVSRGVEREAQKSGLVVLVGTSDDDPVREALYLDLFDEQRVYGLLISPVDNDLHRLERLRERGTPVVLVDRPADKSGFSSVAVDDVAGGYLAVSHLCALGRERICFVGGPLSIRQASDRLTGATRAVKEHPGTSIEILLTDALTVMQGRAAGEELLRRSEANRPDAVFAANDLLAVGLLQALSITGGLRVPEDIAIVGYDDIDFAESTIVPLTSIRQPSQLIGTTAVELLIRLAESDGTSDPEQIVFQPELVIRASTGGDTTSAGL